MLIILSILVFTDILAINPPDNTIMPDQREFVYGEYFPEFFDDFDDEYFYPYYRHFDDEDEGELMPDWMLQDIPSWVLDSVPRWFRSNAGGMELEEVPSRFMALRNTHALVIDYMIPGGLEPLLRPYYNSDFLIEIRVLFKDREEIRRQWRFLDESGLTRLNAVIRYKDPAEEPEEEPEEESEEEPEEELEERAEEVPITEPVHDEVINGIEEQSVENEDEPAENNGSSEENDELPEEIEQTPARRPAAAPRTGPIPVGFIEIFNEETHLITEYLFLDDGDEMQTHYFYNENILIRAETSIKYNEYANAFFERIHTDIFRYNRSYALRNVERIFHGTASIDPIRHSFPYRVLDTAVTAQFLIDNTPVMSDFFGGHSVLEGYRIVYETDARGRVLVQTMFDDDGEVIWVITNVWSDDRITAIHRVEGDDEKITEYEYDSDGDRIVQRDINNGEIERIIRTDGNREVEELFMNGNVILRATWEDGIKISEEMVRH
ncbi:MAG: hypothetical protein FWG89_04775 [Treponema sp.]|nr:hypothetical protein [Treponema sp.]